MEIVETRSEGLARAYEAKASAAEIEAKLDAKIESIRPTAQLKGFRKGKVPAAVLKQLFGKSMMGEVMQEMVDETLRGHIDGNGHRPAKQPDVKISNEDFKPGDDLSVEFSYELLPEVPEIALGDIKLERLVTTVDQASVDEALSRIADNAKTFETKDGASEDGDQAVIDFIGRIDGEAFDGGAADDFPLTLGSGQFIPGFEEQLIGVSAGDEKDVTVDFPADYGAAELAGKTAVFGVTVKEVKAPKPRPLDDELAKQYGADSLEQLTDQVRDRIGEEYRGGARALLKRRLLDHLADTVTFPLPESMVTSEATEIARQLWHDANPQAQGQDQGEVPVEDEHRTLAERRVRLGLLLADIGRRNSVEVTDAEIGNAIMQQARNYPGQEKAFFDFAQQNPEIRQRLSAPVFEDKVVDYIIELAEITEREVDKDGLRAELEKLEAEDADADGSGDDAKPADAAAS